MRVDVGAGEECEKGAAEGRIVGSCQQMARDLVNLPGNYLQAVDIATAAEGSGKLYGYGSEKQ